jgi:hypothetical protein
MVGSDTNKGIRMCKDLDQCWHSRSANRGELQGSLPSLREDFLAFFVFDNQIKSSA